jgi:hypothetical protein
MNKITSIILILLVLFSSCSKENIQEELKIGVEMTFDGHQTTNWDVDVVFNDGDSKFSTLVSAPFDEYNPELGDYQLGVTILNKLYVGDKIFFPSMNNYVVFQLVDDRGNKKQYLAISGKIERTSSGKLFIDVELIDSKKNTKELLAVLNADNVLSD